MKQILIICCLLWGTAQAQQLPGYTDINARYRWLAGVFRALNLPAGNDTALQAGQTRQAGAVWVDTVGSNAGVYYWLFGKWNKVGVGLANLPLYYSGDTLMINPADANNDGYLTAGDYTRFDSAAKMFKDTLTSLPAIVPKDNKLLYVRQLLLGPTSAISFYNTAWDTNPYPLISANPATQNAFYGDRGGATRYLAGTLTGQYNTGIGSQTFNVLTSGDSNTVVGKGAGSFLTTGSNNVYLGHNMSGNGYATVSGRLGIGGNGIYWIMGEGYGADITVPQQTISLGDSDQTIAHTKYVKQAIAAALSGGGGVTNLKPEMELQFSNFTITEPTDNRTKTYTVIPSGTSVTVTAPASPTDGQIIIIFLQYLTPGSSVTVPTWDGTRTLTTNGTSFVLQYNATLGGYTIIGGS